MVTHEQSSNNNIQYGYNSSWMGLETTTFTLRDTFMLEGVVSVVVRMSVF